MITYKLNKDRRTGEDCSVNRTDDNGQVWSIPFVEDNTDYQKYLEWVAEGNTPEPADE
jgi:hypothetical protein